MICTGTREDDKLHDEIIEYTEFNLDRNEEQERWHFYLQISRDTDVPFRRMRNAWNWIDLRVVNAYDRKTDPEKVRLMKASRLSVNEDDIQIVFYI